MLNMDEIEARRRALRLPYKDLGAMAGLDHQTVARSLKRKNPPRYGSHEKIEQALLADELRQRDRLLGLHPLQAEDKPA